MPQVTSLAPEFAAQAVVKGQIKKVSLKDYEGKWKILFFYPLDFTFVCPTEIIAFSDRHSEFEALNAQVIGVSVDSQFTHLAWINTPRKQGGLGECNYPLVADLDKSIARDFGVLLDAGMALRGLFLIDPKGVIRHSTINDLPVGRSVDETIRVLKAFQYVETHGEVCPANWEEGKPSMKADPIGSKTYFEKVNG